MCCESKFRRSLFLLFLPLLLSACELSDDPGLVTGVKAAAGASCTTASSCVEGYECVGKSGSYTCVKACTTVGATCDGLDKTCAASDGPDGQKNACTGETAPDPDPVVKAAAGASCTTVDGCVEGYECVGESGSYTCVKACTTVGDTCDGLDKTCAASEGPGGTKNACTGDPVPVVKAEPGESCTTADGCVEGYECVGESGAYTCRKGCTLPDGLECGGTGRLCASTAGPDGNKEACTAPTGAGDPCSATEPCKEGYKCVKVADRPDVQGNQHFTAACMKGCTPPDGSSSDGATEGTSCDDTGMGCIKADGLEDGTSETVCAAPLQALMASENPPTLGKDCTSNDDCKFHDNSFGMKCVDIGTGTYKCVQGCNVPGSDCMTEGFVCGETTTVDGSKTKACVASPKTALSQYKACTPDLVKSFKSPASPIALFDTVNPHTPVMSTGPTDYSEVTFISGNAILGPQQEALFYLDLNKTDESVKVGVNDEDAFTQNKDWQVAFRYYDFFVNGGPLPGDYEIAGVKGADTKFETYSKEDAMALGEDLFKTSTIVTTSCKPNIFYMLGMVPSVVTAPVMVIAGENIHIKDYNQDVQLSPYYLGMPWAWLIFGEFLPDPSTFNRFYVIKKRDGSWYAKLRVKSIQKLNPKKKTASPGDPDYVVSREVTFTIDYKAFN